RLVGQVIRLPAVRDESNRQANHLPTTAAPFTPRLRWGKRQNTERRWPTLPSRACDGQRPRPRGRELRDAGGQRRAAPTPRTSTRAIAYPWATTRCRGPWKCGGDVAGRKRTRCGRRPIARWEADS